MRSAPDLFILAAPYFDEVAVVTCLSEVRGHGLTAVLVSTTSGLLSGHRGITLRPDMSLTQIESQFLKHGQIVIIAGGVASAANMLADPRVHHLIQQVLGNDGYVVGMRNTNHLLTEAGLWQSQNRHQWLWQEGEETAVFIQQLINIQFQIKGEGYAQKPS